MGRAGGMSIISTWHKLTRRHARGAIGRASCQAALTADGMSACHGAALFHSFVKQMQHHKAWSLVQWQRRGCGSCVHACTRT